jgi:hypothetical protein
MKMKVLGAVCVSLTVSLTSAFAQSTAVTTTVSPTLIPKTELSFSPSVFTGMRSVLSGTVSGSASDANTVGAFVIPGIEVGLKYPKVTAGITYGAEISSAKGFGPGKAGNRNLSDNFYVEHNPVMTLSAGGNTKFNMLADLKWHIENKDSSLNKSEYFLNPEVEQKISGNLALSAGYVMHRLSNFDTTFGTRALNAEIKKAAEEGRAATVVPATAISGSTPVQTLNAGLITAKINITKATKLVSYVRAGRWNSNDVSKVGLQYRFNADLTTTPTAKTELALRYRLNLEDKKNTFSEYYQLGRIIAAYNVNSNIALNLQNTMTVNKVRSNGSKAEYENEQYLGATYKF